MAAKPQPSPSITLSTGLLRLLSEDGLAIKIADCRNDLMRMIDLCQRDAVSEATHATAGSVVLAMKRLGDTVAAFADAGDAQIEAIRKSETAQAKKANSQPQYHHGRRK